MNFVFFSHLPLYMVAAFAKKIARLSLSAPPQGCYGVPLLFWSHDLLCLITWFMVTCCRCDGCHGVYHKPTEKTSKLSSFNTQEECRRYCVCCAPCMQYYLLHPCVEVCLESDPFVMSERDLAQCRALESCLWELKVRVRTDRFVSQPYSVCAHACDKVGEGHVHAWKKWLAHKTRSMDIRAHKRLQG